MPGLLYHSPARILAETLIQAGFGIDGEGVEPDRRGQWPIYVGREPDRPDQIIKVSNTMGVDSGTTQIDGERQERQGIQVFVRSCDEETGYYKLQSIAIFLNRLARTITDITQLESVGTGDIDYILHSVDVTSNVLALGLDAPSGKRHLFSLNATVTVRQCCH